MDEPFSAVDPVVREQLQNEFLRLQSELGKTIAFVTHDIDEAIKLGDKVAVMRVGGKLAQFAEPAELLSRPADAFVAGFVGRDRGYRALGFAAAGDAADRRRGRRAARRTGRARPTTARRTGGRSSSTTTTNRRAGSPSAGCPAPRSTARSRPTCSTSAARSARPVRHAARGARRRAVLAQRARRHRRRRRPVRRHGHRRRGARAHRVAALPASVATR